MTRPAPLSAVLKRIRDTELQPLPRPGERCELCAALITDDHGHVVDLESRALMCACRPCYLVFAPDGAGGARFRAVPDRFLALSDTAISTEQWDALQVPVDVAFFFVNSALGQVAAFYPGPAGATESQLSMEHWDDLVTAGPELAMLRPDVEALLVRGASKAGAALEAYIVPIDACYELVGQLRMLWKGFDGGTQAHDALDACFERVRSRARP